ncbi:rhamnulose-1-phosphate aldolase [Oceanicaulis sp. AH-315-P02]|nr:rhamnulose-1-phosphate aldolase [Robiginitomaculum sp.]MBN4047877.1 rhamnulose-1-phosphate aldolase [Oceanicaulis sp. AH-315-P02]
MSNLHSDNSIPFAAQFQSIAHWLAVKGWSEAAGGNMSIRIDAPTGLPETTFIALPVPVPHLAGKALVVTGSGTRCRDIAREPDPSLGLYKIGASGEDYCWLAGNKKPTMELPAHCAIHNTLAEYRPKDIAILHTHPANLIALCHWPDFTNGTEISNRILSLQSEARLHLPEGVGFVEHELPGSLILGLKSAEQVKQHQLVLWQYHGCLATGSSLDHAFDSLEIFDKCAEIFWKLKAAGIDPKGIAEDTIKETLQFFGQLDRYPKQ